MADDRLETLEGQEDPALGLGKPLQTAVSVSERVSSSS
jgi:hypothetical protein